jgi:hypothetical protein
MPHKLINLTTVLSNRPNSSKARLSTNLLMVVALLKVVHHSGLVHLKIPHHPSIAEVVVVAVSTMVVAVIKHL